MKKRLLILALCLGTGGISAANPLAAINDDPPPRMEKIGRERTIPLVRDGKTEMEIVIPADAFPIVRFAAEEIQKTLQKASGAEIPVLNAPSGSGRTVLFLGDQEAVRGAGIKVDSIPRDGFILKTAGRQIYLAGRDDPKLRPDARGWGVIRERGTLHGAYSFLERFAGVRYYFPGEIGTVIPENKNIAMPETELLDRPDFPRRRVGFFGKNWIQEVDPGMAGLYHFRLRTESFYVPCCHGLERMKYQLRFTKTHPEYIAMDANGKRYLDPGSPYYGNICYISEGMRNEIYRDAEAFLTGKPASSRGLASWDPSSAQPGFFDLMPKDHFKDCMCPECQKFYAAHPKKSDLVWDLLNDIAGRLKKNGIPGMVTMLAYGHYTDVPEVELQDNVLMQVAVNGPWAETNPALQRKHDRRILDWKKKMNRKPWLWTYIGKYGALELPGVPPLTPRAVGSYFKRQAGNICGGFVESESDFELTQYLNLYVFSRVAWDNRTDVDALLKEHHRLMFGKGAAPMGRFFDRIEELWMNRIAGRIVETPVGPQAVPPSDYELWEKIYSPAELKKFDALFDEAASLAKGDPGAEKRIAYFRKYILNTIREASEQYFRNAADVGKLAYDGKSLERGETIVIDGRLDDPAWKKAPEEWLVPFKGDVSEAGTRFRLMKDARYLYGSVFCEEPEPEQMMLNCKARDDKMLWQDSGIEFFLSPDGDRRNYIHFIINADGVVYDAKCERMGGESRADIAWNSSVEVKAGRGKDAWTLEFRIPLKDLAGFNPEKAVFNMARNRNLKSPCGVKLYTWSPYIKGFHDSLNYGRLRFDVPAEEKLIENGDFTIPFSGRYFGGWWADQNEVNQGFIAYDGKIFRKGGQSLRIRNDGKKRRLVTQWLPKLKSNTTYQLTYDLKMEDVKSSGNDGGVVINFGAPANVFYPKNRYFGTMPWTSQGMTFKTGVFTKEHPAFIRLQFFPGTGTVWFDNLQLKEIKEQP